MAAMWASWSMRATSTCVCISWFLSKHEQNYGSCTDELYVVVWACKTLRHYLHGVTFTLITDRCPLEWLMQSQTLSGQAAHRVVMLMESYYTVVHRPGVTHQNADTLSRSPCLALRTARGRGCIMSMMPPPLPSG